jgi:hypothetical protein
MVAKHPLCHNCWEVEGRLPTYLRSEAGRKFVRDLMPKVDDWTDEGPDSWDYEAVLTKYGVTMCAPIEEFTGDTWTLSWHNGCMGIDTLNEKHARRGAALFVELWNRGFSASFADKLIDGYLRFLELQEDFVQPVNPIGYGFQCDPFQMLVEVVQETYGVTPVHCTWVPVGSSIKFPVDPAQSDPVIGISSSMSVEDALERLIEHLAQVVMVRHFGGSKSIVVKGQQVIDRIRTEFYLRMDEVVGPPTELRERSLKDFAAGRFSTPQECIDQLKESGDSI